MLHRYLIMYRPPVKKIGIDALEELYRNCKWKPLLTLWIAMLIPSSRRRFTAIRYKTAREIPARGLAGRSDAGRSCRFIEKAFGVFKENKSCA